MLAPQRVEMGAYEIVEFPDSFLIVLAGHCSVAPQMKSGSFTNNLLSLLRQRKNKKCGSGWRDMGGGFGINFSKPALRLRATTRPNGDVLPPVDRVADGSGGDAAPGVEGPKLLAGSSIQSEDVALQIAAKNQVARGGQERRHVVVLGVEGPLLLPRHRIEGADVWRNIRIQFVAFIGTANKMGAQLKVGAVPPPGVRTVSRVLNAAAARMDTRTNEIVLLLFRNDGVDGVAVLVYALIPVRRAVRKCAQELACFAVVFVRVAVLGRMDDHLPLLSRHVHVDEDRLRRRVIVI